MLMLLKGRAPYLLLLVVVFSSFACNNKNPENRDNEPKVEGANDIVDLNVSSIQDEQSSNAEILVDAMDVSKLNDCQKNVQQLLGSCVDENYSAAAKVIMYRGSDERRNGQDSFNLLNASEANTVKVTCDVISAWLGESKSYEFITYQEEETEFGMQYVVEVLFTQEKLGVKRHLFYFMDTPKGKLLVNMI
jgi:hypothetical protein